MLSIPWLYREFQNALGARNAIRTIAERHVRPFSGCRILDAGCGPATVLDFLSDVDVDYVGVDASPASIEAAKRRHGDQGRFVCADAGDIGTFELGSFDVILAIGLLHHLDDVQADRFLSAAFGLLKDSGHLVTVDPCFVDRQSPIARFLIRHDRGQNVRTARALMRLISARFPVVETWICNLSRIPYTHIIAEGFASADEDRFSLPQERVLR